MKELQRIEIGNMTIEQADMLMRMATLRADRLEGWTVDIVQEFPLIPSADEETILGSFTWTNVAKKHKMLAYDYARNLGGGWCSPADIARDYIECKYTERRRWRGYQAEHFGNDKKGAPLAANPICINDAVYIDLKSAYWQILLAGGWDVDYYPLRHLGVKSDVSDFPVPFYKLSRNCLVTAGLEGGMQVWNGSVIEQRPSGNRFANMMLWGFVMDVLNTFAYEMVHICKAQYVHTDGYIIPAKYERTAMRLADAWGLIVSAKHRGRAEINGVGRYKIGGHETPQRLSYPNHGFYKINPIDGRWLRPRIAKNAQPEQL